MRSIPLGIAHVGLTVALVIAAASGLTRALPVSATFGDAIVPIAVVSLSAAVAVLSGWSAIARFARGLVTSPRARAVEHSQVAGVTVFLVAQLNGITAVTSLVPLYTIAAGSTLFLLLSEQDREAGGSGRRPFILGSAVGIVPWGVIAFQQVGSIIAGSPPDPLVRVVTIAVLLVAAAQWVASWRGITRAPAVLFALNAVALAIVAVVRIA
jgi:hypothetical protein